MTGNQLLTLIRYQLGGAAEATQAQFPLQELIDHLNQAQRYVQLVFDAYAPSLMCDYGRDPLGNLPVTTSGKAEYVLTLNVGGNWGDYFVRPRAVRFVEPCASNNVNARTGARLPRFDVASAGALYSGAQHYWSDGAGFSETLNGKGILFSPVPSAAQRYYVFYNQYAPDWTTVSVGDGTLSAIPDAYADMLVAIASVLALRKHDQESAKRVELLADLQRMEQALAATHTGQVEQTNVYGRFLG